MKHLALWYDGKGTPHVEFHDTEAEALANARDTAQAYLDAGDSVPYTDDWCVAKITHNVRVSEIPFQDTRIETEAEAA